MKVKKLISFFLTATLVLGLCGCGSGGQPVFVLSSDGDVLARLENLSQIQKDKNKAYLQIAVDEAVKIIAEKEKISEKSAEKQLFKGGYNIYTAYDTEVGKALEETCDMLDTDINIGSAVTDLKGNLVAVYSTDSKDKINFSTKACDPCSAFKPLSVYAQAIDKDIINWSSRYEDSPYKQVKGEDGIYRDWPRNATGIYTKRYAYTFQAVKESINTVAVKCLKDLGVNNSIDFLQSQLGISLADEKYTASVYGEDEIIGNIALGSLSKGVSPVDMAGYYQMFANGGFYSKPTAVHKITDAQKNEIYKKEETLKQVIKATTSELMNRLLREVVTTGGTGAKAYSEGVEVAGKTGTDELGDNNWFVGLTPEYSCSIWHSNKEKNTAPEIFSAAIYNIYKNKPSAQKVFTYKAGLSSVAYCTETGMMAKQGCALIRLGYYTHGNVPSLCDRH